VVGSAFAQVLTHVAASVLGNLLATVLSIPIVLMVGALAFGTRSLSVIPLGVTLLVAVMPNPCTAGIQSVAHELALGEDITFRDHWQGFRRYARLAGIAWLGSVAVTAVILANLAFYAHAVGASGGILQAIAPVLFFLWLLLCIPWISLHLYVFPLLIEQEVKSIPLIYRNAFLMAMGRPAVLLVVVPLWLALLVIFSTTGVVTFIGLALSASIQQNATKKLLPTFRLVAGS